jgi:DtxR family Mn-dependent transcriptional regulator
MRNARITRVVEDYVTLIWKAYEWPGGAPSTTDLAAQLAVTPSTVSSTLKKLERDGFIAYEPYGAIELRPAGHDLAVEIIRRHRIVETYLHRELGMSWDEVHVEADSLEHAVSDALLARMDDVLGHPEHDPHGDPIPDAAGRVARDTSHALADVAAGTDVRVTRVSDRSPEILRHLEGVGIGIGTILTVAGVSLEAGAVSVVVVGGVSVQLGLPTAAAVRVAPEPAA